MSTLSIEVNTVSATLFNGNAAIEAHAGNAESIQKWIDKQKSKHGNIKVYGGYRLKMLRDKEQEEKELINV